MALVRLTDAIVPDVFANYMVNDTMEKADVFASGVIQQDAEMSRLMTGGGRLFQHPVWGDLDNTEANLGSDDPAQVLVPRKLGSFKHQFVRQFRTQGWSAADLVKELAGSDPMKRISSRVSEYWARQFNRYTIATLNGATNAVIANNGGDQVYDITARTGTVPVGDGNRTTSAFKVHAEAILEAKQTMGDAASQLSLLIMHSRVYTNLQQQNLIAFIPNSQGVVNIPTYMGYRVLVSDTVPVTVSGADLIYTTYLVASGIIGFTENPPDMPVETKREALQGNGAGVDILVTRRQFAMHPYGFNFTDASTAGEFPTIAELEMAANWTRVYPERKQVKWAILLSKNG